VLKREEVKIWAREEKEGIFRKITGIVTPLEIDEIQISMIDFIF